MQHIQGDSLTYLALRRRGFKMEERRIYELPKGHFQNTFRGFAALPHGEQVQLSISEEA